MTKRKADPSSEHPFNPHEVWMAGLSALSQAQQQGRQAVQDLVQQGEALQQQAQAQWTELTQRMTNPFAAVAPSASKLEGIFEQRVAQALHAMGMPNAADVRALQEEVLALHARLAALEQAAAPTPPAARRRSASAKRATTPRKP